jgi:hypothetical protein
MAMADYGEGKAKNARANFRHEFARINTDNANEQKLDGRGVRRYAMP